MTGICLLLLAAVLAALWLLKRKNAPKVWGRILIALTALSMTVIFGAMAAIIVQGRDDVMPEKAPQFVVVLGAQIQGDQPSLTLKKRLDRAYEYLTEHPVRFRLRRTGAGRAADGGFGHVRLSDGAGH